MGFSSEWTKEPEGMKNIENGKEPHAPSFGDRLLGYMQSRYPIAGGLAGMVFQNQQQPAPSMEPAQMEMPDYSQMISMNSQPKETGGLDAILKLLGGAG